MCTEFDDDGPSVDDTTLGLPGPATPMPEDDADQVYVGNVNDEDDADDD